MATRLSLLGVNLCGNAFLAPHSCIYQHPSRQNLGNSTSPSIWPALRHLWSLISVAYQSADPKSDSELRRLYMDTCAALARFTRNLVAGNAANQMKALFVPLLQSYLIKSDVDLKAATSNQRFESSSLIIPPIL